MAHQPGKTLIITHSFDSRVGKQHTRPGPRFLGQAEAIPTARSQTRYNEKSHIPELTGRRAGATQAASIQFGRLPSLLTIVGARDGTGRRVLNGGDPQRSARCGSVSSGDGLVQSPPNSGMTVLRFRRNTRGSTYLC